MPPTKKRRRNEAPLTLVINLQRRGDRLRKLRGVLRGRLSTWEIIEAVDGRVLSWKDAAPHLTAKALADAQWAEKKQVPTICQRTGSFSPHFTLSAVGCALSHRKAWQHLAGSKEHDWALILEDDIACVSVDLEGAVERCVASLPSSWQFCKLHGLAYHRTRAPGSPAHTPEMRMRVSELVPTNPKPALR